MKCLSADDDAGVRETECFQAASSCRPGAPISSATQHTAVIGKDLPCNAGKMEYAYMGKRGPNDKLQGSSSSTLDITDSLLLGSAQSPMTAIKETGELLAKLVLMYVVLQVAAGLVKGQSPLQQLLLAAVHLRLVFHAMLAPLSMMCSGFVLALVQYSIILRQQRPAPGLCADGQQPASAVGASKGKQE